MISTKNIITNYKDVPETWIFEHYCKLNKKLIGQNEKIKSMFNEKDKIPSMCIYFDKTFNCYKFKDFSSGYSGSGVDLVKYLFNIDFSSAAHKIISDYQEYLLYHKEYKLNEFKEYDNYKVTNYSIRLWNTLDREFWVKYNIGSKILNMYNVFPLLEYTMSKNENKVEKSITISGEYIYGYFKSDGSLYKIYQPKSKKKFIKVKQYIQGVEQLEGHTNLLITSSLKDIISIKSLGLNVDCIAPDSENTMIPKSELLKIIKKYKTVSVMFDNDDAGIASMMKYKEQYNFKVFILPMSKDISDSIKDFGVKKVLYTFVPILQKCIDEVTLLNA
jgi:hypothetical protein